VTISPLRAAALARTFRRKARASFDAGDFGHAAVLFRMAMAAQGLAIADDMRDAA
jgi:hypothetical protein